MRRFAVCGFVALAVGLVLAPGALASTGVRHAVPLGTRHAAAAPAASARLGADVTYNISGHVLDFGGTGIADTEVDWGYWDPISGYVGEGYNPRPGTDATGAFNFTGVSGGHQMNGQPSDDLHIFYNPLGNSTYVGLEEMEAYTLDFSTNNDGSSYSYDMRPAQVDVTITNTSGSLAEVKAGNAMVGYVRADVPLVSGTGTASVLPMTNFDDLIAYGYTSIGTCAAQAEWSTDTPVGVVAGATAPAITLDWNAALHASLAGPTCQHSGKPGSTVKMVLNGWPVDGQPEFVAYYGNGSSHDYGSTEPKSTGSTLTVPLKLSTSAPIDVAEIDTYRLDNVDSLVGMWDYYQVCTFKSTASAIRHGHAIRLSGVLPAAAGRVTLYSTTHKVTAQPATLAAKGWTKMGAYKVASGKFATGLLHPKRTTWYVVKYSGYAFPAFTSVVKVYVH
jgi:hypothetical protein